MTTAKIPDIGDTFTHHDARYRVSNWLKPQPNPRPSSRRVGPDNVPLVFCVQDEAVYVSGSGVGGCIARIADITIDGRVDWSEETFERSRRSAAYLVGQEIF